jgi:hypothetical protein
MHRRPVANKLMQEASERMARTRQTVSDDMEHCTAM